MISQADITEYNDLLAPAYEVGQSDQSVSGRVRPPVKWHGGKYPIAPRIIQHFPPHHTYVEPFGGAASVLLAKPPSPVEVYNDLDERITRLFRVIRNHGEELHRRLSLTPYSEIEFRNSEESAGDEIEKARRDFVRWRLSFGGRGGTFSFTKHRVRRNMADVVSGYLSAIDEVLPQVIERLQTVQVVCRPAVEVIKIWDGPETLIYCDPPYLHSTRARGSTSVYDYEMSEDDHVKLAGVLNECQAKVVVSGYPSPVYEDLYQGWHTVTFDVANHAASGKDKERKAETLWIKP